MPRQLQSLLVACLWLLLAGLSCSPLGAAESEIDASARRHNPSIWVVEIENDILTNTDRYYTSGTAISRVNEMREPPAWLRRVANRFPGFDDAQHLPYRLTVHYNLYTPRNISDPEAPPKDRPYAAWLNFQFATGTQTENGADRVHIGLGIVGPWAFGKEIQTSLHSAIGSPKPYGWANQIRNEPTVQLGYDRLRRIWRNGRPGHGGMDISLTGGALAGNAHSNITVGGLLRAGHNLSTNFGPPRITPAVSGSRHFVPQERASWYFHAGVEGRRVFRDLFIEGNTFGGTRGASRERLVGETFAGFVYTRGPLRMSYTQTWRDHEFVGQVGRQSFGSLSFSLWW